MKRQSLGWSLLVLALALPLACSKAPTEDPVKVEAEATASKARTVAFVLDDPRYETLDDEQLPGHRIDDVRGQIEIGTRAYAAGDFNAAREAFGLAEFTYGELRRFLDERSWTAELGIEGLDQPMSIERTGDGYAISGRARGETDLQASLCVLEFDGTLRFRALFGGASRDAATYARERRGGGYWLAGVSSSFADFSGDAYLVRTDAQGNLEWEKTYGESGTDIGIDVFEMGVGGAVLFARSFFGGEGMNLLVIPVGPDGAAINRFTFGGPGDQHMNTVVQLDEDRFLAAGTTGTLNNNDGKPLLMIVDAQGEEHMRAEIDAPGFINPESVFVQPAADGGFVMVAGYLTEDKQLPAWSGKDKSESIVLFKLDAEGVPEWSRSYGGDLWDSPRGVFVVDGDYIVVAATESFGAGGEDILLFRTDGEGERIWERTIGDVYDEFPRAADWAGGSAGGLVIAATRHNTGDAESDLDTFVVKTDSLGRVWRDGEQWSTDGLTPRPDPDAVEAPADFLVAEDSPEVGDEAPEINAAEWLNTESGPTLAGLRGEVAVVEFWATWCGPCRATIPHLRELHEKYREKGVRIVSLTDEDRQEANIDGFVADNGMPYTIGTGSTSIADYGVIGIPTAFVVGRDGIILWRGHPQGDLEAAIEEALGKQP